MKYYPSGKQLIAWTPSMEEAVVEVARKALEGHSVVLRYFENTKRDEGPVWLVKLYAVKKKQKGPLLTVVEGGQPVDPDAFDEKEAA